jgi:hypothetical protein
MLEPFCWTWSPKHGAKSLVEEVGRGVQPGGLHPVVCQPAFEGLICPGLGGLLVLGERPFSKPSTSTLMSCLCRQVLGDFQGETVGVVEFEGDPTGNLPLFASQQVGEHFLEFVLPVSQSLEEFFLFPKEFGLDHIPPADNLVVYALVNPKDRIRRNMPGRVQ